MHKDKMSNKQENGFYGWTISKKHFQDLRDSGASFFGQYIWSEEEQCYSYHRCTEQSPGRPEAVKYKENEMSNRVGLMVGRFQPLHRGHTKSINIMIQDCETAIVCLGSAQKKRERHDPWSVEERIEMLKNVYGDRIKIVPLKDIGAVTPEQWVDYIFVKLEKLGMKEPTDYYTGSEFDASWYNEYFWNGSDIPTSKFHWMGTGNNRILHILDREKSPVPSATEIRMSLELRNDMWKEWTPAVNHHLVWNQYPTEFMVPFTK